MEQRFVKIKDEESLIRDQKSNAVLNTDMTSLQKYKAKREKDRQMQQDIDNLKSDMSEIKQLLQQLVNRD
jgi:predicted RNA-binding protein YlxR (DUF448 family)